MQVAADEYVSAVAPLITVLAFIRTLKVWCTNFPSDI